MDKIDFKILIAMAVVFIAWSLWTVYQFAAQYREPLDLPPSEFPTATHAPSYPVRFTCEGHQCDKL
jgi:hypothetical protein